MAMLPLLMYCTCPAAGQTYLGCWADSSYDKNVAGGDTWRRDDLTIGVCRGICVTQGYAVFGVSYGAVCACTNATTPTVKTYDKHFQQVEDACHMYPCPGNARDFCGGYFAHRVFAISCKTDADCLWAPKDGANRSQSCTPSGLCVERGPAPPTTPAPAPQANGRCADHTCGAGTVAKARKAALGCEGLCTDDFCCDATCAHAAVTCAAGEKAQNVAGARCGAGADAAAGKKVQEMWEWCAFDGGECACKGRARMGLPGYWSEVDVGAAGKVACTMGGAGPGFPYLAMPGFPNAPWRMCHCRVPVAAVSCAEHVCARGRSRHEYALENAFQSTGTNADQRPARALDNDPYTTQRTFIFSYYGEFWEASLPQVAPITAVVLYNRRDTNPLWLFGLRVIVSKTIVPEGKSALTVAGPDAVQVDVMHTAGKVERVVFPPGTVGRYVYVQVRARMYLSLAEVRVEGLPCATPEECDDTCCTVAPASCTDAFCCKNSGAAETPAPADGAATCSVHACPPPLVLRDGGVPCGGSAAACTDVMCCAATCAHPAFKCGSSSVQKTPAAASLLCGPGNGPDACTDALCCVAACAQYACGAGLTDKVGKAALLCGAQDSSSCSDELCCDANCANKAFKCPSGQEKNATRAAQPCRAKSPPAAAPVPGTPKQWRMCAIEDGPCTCSGPTRMGILENTRQGLMRIWFDRTTPGSVECKKPIFSVGVGLDASPHKGGPYVQCHCFDDAAPATVTCATHTCVHTGQYGDYVLRDAHQSSLSASSYGWSAKPVGSYNLTAVVALDNDPFTHSHTLLEKNPWWRAELRAPLPIEAVVIENRHDCCWERLANYRVVVSAYAQDPTDLCEFTGCVEAVQVLETAAAGPTVRVVFPPGTRGKHVMVQILGSSYLHIGEVRVEGPPCTTGAACESLCCAGADADACEAEACGCAVPMPATPVPATPVPANTPLPETEEPISFATDAPTAVPDTSVPTAVPTAVPTTVPETATPTAAPTPVPATGVPETAAPELVATTVPTAVPTDAPTAAPNTSVPPVATEPPRITVAPTPAPTPVPGVSDVKTPAPVVPVAPSGGDGALVWAVLAGVAAVLIGAACAAAVLWFGCGRRHGKRERGGSEGDAHTNIALGAPTEMENLQTASLGDPCLTTSLVTTPTTLTGGMCSLSPISYSSQQPKPAEAAAGGTSSGNILQAESGYSFFTYEAGRRSITRGGGSGTRSLAGFTQEKLLGAGRYGSVYLVVLRNGDKVAMKEQAQASKEDAALALEQVLLLKKCDDPGLVKLYDVVLEPSGSLRIFMQYVEGGTLLNVVRNLGGKLPEGRAAKYTQDITSGLRCLHSYGYVHRDVKCENVLLAKNEGQAKLCDYGFLKEMDTGVMSIASGSPVSEAQRLNTVVGSPCWMAPEVLQGRYGTKCDVYSLGCTVSEMLNEGVPPSGGFSDNIYKAMLTTHVVCARTHVAEASESATAFILACLNPVSEERPTTEALSRHKFLGLSQTSSTFTTGSRSTNTVSSLQTPSSGSKKLEKWHQIGAPLGRGAFGTVYLGLLSDGSRIAVKVVVPRSVPDTEKVEEEFKLLQSLEHPNIVRCHGHRWTPQNQLEIYLEYVDGGSLSALLRDLGGKPLPPEMVRRSTEQMLQGLRYMHDGSAGRPPVAHRDIKGANVLVSRDGDIKLTDFGCSKGGVHGTCAASTLVGTPYWMAPEVLQSMSGADEPASRYGTKCDIWSLGCTVVEMHGVTPWLDCPGQNCSNYVDLLITITKTDAIPSIPGEVSADLTSFLKRCFARPVNERASAEDLLAHPYVTTVIRSEEDEPTPDFVVDGPLL